jgi:hypothetical protein
MVNTTLQSSSPAVDESSPPHNEARSAAPFRERVDDGQIKLDDKLASNHLAGALGNAIHALLCGAGHNLRLLLRHLAKLFCALLRLLATPTPQRHAALELA